MPPCRVYLGYHSWQQVLCGGLLGATVAGLWFLLVQVSPTCLSSHIAGLSPIHLSLYSQFVFTPLFPWLVHNRVAGWLLLRDLSLIPNVMWFEYVQSRTEAKQVLATSWSSSTHQICRHTT